MKTPNVYVDSVKAHIITREILGECLYSVNKRAKNCRDKQKSYSSYEYKEKYRQQKERYYEKKDTLLAIVTPDCIHKEVQQVRRRVYDYEDEYSAFDYNNEFVYEGSYYDRDLDERVYFGDVYFPEDRYYLFYDFGKFSFHTPIEESNLKKYLDLEIIKIDNLKTEGHDIKDLISTNFIGKVLDLIKSGEYQFINA